MQRKGLILLTTIMALFTMVGFAMAANQANVNVTSEPIGQGATCAKAGGFSLEFDAGTTLTAGDQITIDLELGVTLCQGIDLLVAPTASAAGSGWVDGNVAATSSPLTAPNVATNGLTYTGNGVVFWITGTNGQARITVDVLEADLNGDGTLGNDTGATTGSITVAGATADDKLILNFLDQETNTSFTTDGIWSNTNDSDYAEAATLAQNTICIDVSAFGGTTVNASMDSKADKFTFIPSNPQIAHIVSASQYQFEGCKDQTVGTILMGGSVAQGADSCDAFDNETGASYCTNTHANNEMIIQSVNGAFPSVSYDVTLEIRVNGATGDNGVYWSNQAVQTQGYDTEDAACTGAGLANVGGTTTYTNGVGAGASPAAPSVDDCTIAASERAVTITITGDDLDLAATNDYLLFNLPAFNYDLDEIASGDVVSVYVTLTQAPCTVLFEGAFTVGTFIDECATTVSNTLTYPYFGVPNPTQDATKFWNAIVVTNLSTSDGTATMMLYEMDGDVATATATVGANSMTVQLLSTITWTQTSGSGTIGDSRSYIIVTTDFNADGFAMIAKSGTGESMGYLPRN